MKKIDRSTYGQEGIHWEVDPSTGCWHWLRFKDKGGYGRISRFEYAHRVIYERFKGKVPEGLHLDHLCRNRGCVNPEHLEPVTRAVNTQRGFLPSLTPRAVKFIRDVYAYGAGVYRISKVFGVYHPTIIKVVRRKTWANI